MAVKTIIFLGLFVVCSAGALFSPILGVLGYVAYYAIGGQWWIASVGHLGIRYPLVLALATAVGIVLNWRKLRSRGPLFLAPEKLAMLFLAIMWAATLAAPMGMAEHVVQDHPAVKLTKIIVFTLMLTHVVTTPRNLARLLWVLVITSLMLGLKAYEMPRSAFLRGRLEGVGGSDFREANFFAAYMAAMLPIIGVQFLRSKWVGKIVCLASGAFTANAIILTRSRGAVVGIAGGCLVAAVLAPKRYRLKIAGGLIVAAGGFLYLTDPQFRDRASTITRSEEEMDSSALSRIRLAEAGVKMLADNPLGVGVGNFHQNIGKYIPEYAGKDAHNTFVRCMTETGVVGILTFGGIILAALLSLRRSMKRSHDVPDPQQQSFLYVGYGLLISLVTLLGCTLTVSLTYVEYVWWLLMLPVCLERAVANHLEDVKAIPVQAGGSEGAGVFGGRRMRARRPRHEAVAAGASTSRQFSSPPQPGPRRPD